MARNPIHPGEYLTEQLCELGLSAAGLSRQIKVPVNRITRIMRGERAVRADMALRLGHWCGTGPQVWISLRQLYAMRVAELDVGVKTRMTP